MPQLNDFVVQMSILMLIYACAVAFPALQTETEKSKLTHLIDELREELEVTRNEDKRTNYFSGMPLQSSQAINQKKSATYGSFNSFSLKSSPLISALENRGGNSGEIGLDKRQGSWDYDYGLGGGRFGKRNGFMDYALGGGRFGRDVDHVREFDSEAIDFEDFTDD